MPNFDNINCRTIYRLKFLIKSQNKYYSGKINDILANIGSFEIKTSEFPLIKMKLNVII